MSDTTNTTGLRELPEKWRNDVFYPQPGDDYDTRKAALNACADELDAALSQPQPGRVEGMVEVVRIQKPARLDPITLYIADEGGGRGRMTIVCYNQAWTCYWGAMGNRSLREFVGDCDASYVAMNMLSGLGATDDAYAYATRIAVAVIAALQAAAPTAGGAS